LPTLSEESGPDRSARFDASLSSGRCVLIGEVAQAHDGSLGMAHAFIDAIAAAGADAVKFQTHIAAAESTAAEPWRVPFSAQDATRREYWRRMEFSEDAWHGLRKHAAERGLHFISSPFSIDAVHLLERVGVSAWKVASGEVGNVPLLESLTRARVPVLLSSGMSPFAELDSAVTTLRRFGVAVAALQTTSAYPCPPEKIGLNMLEILRSRYGCPVGLSDHSGTIYPGLAAATLGANVLEVHVTLSREMFGPDVVASVTTSELKQLAIGLRFIESMRRHPVDKDAVAAEMMPLRTAFTKSVVARSALTAGTVLTSDHVALKKPGTGIPPVRLPEIIGCRLRRNLDADELIQETDLER
jgi:N-acetylneuraminate synthase